MNAQVILTIVLKSVKTILDRTPVTAEMVIVSTEMDTHAMVL